MSSSHKTRRTFAALVVLIVAIVAVYKHPDAYETKVSEAPSTSSQTQVSNSDTGKALERLLVKGRAPKTGYARTQFGDGWATEHGCDTRNIILNRDLTEVTRNKKCQVVTGILHDPYTDKIIQFHRGETSSQDVQIDHVVALSDAWQTGAQNLSHSEREKLANDPLELLAVDGPANQQKSDGDAATWLPSNKPFRCQYVARQIAVKQKYYLWVTSAEKAAMSHILVSCPQQKLPSS